ncbi:MAG: hypothetical protein K9H26_10100 [Prolixibacteraceae bacterium]|nr:hypothetical protein [Prolixibacteraceae bacterium]
MKEIFNIYGLKRSGNHAIINWLSGQFEFEFYNNIIPIAPILKGEKKIPDIIHFNNWIETQNLTSFKKKSIKNKTCYVVSLEDHFLEIKPFIYDPDSIVKNILILRTPENLFASRIRKASKVNNPAYPLVFNNNMQRAIDLWLQYVKEFFNETNFLVNKVCILFDEWYINKAYREETSQKLGITFDDINYSRISTLGGGSSFNNISNNNFNLLNRSKLLNKYELNLLQEVMKINEINEYRNKIYSTFNIS